MISAIKSRDLAWRITMSEGINAGRSPEELDRMKFKVGITRPGEENLEMVTVPDLLERARPLESLKTHCYSCGCSGIGMYEATKEGVKSEGKVQPEPFSCYRTIQYPISAKAEEWLAGVARSAIEEGGARKVLVDYILEENETGEWAASMRAYRERPFFELAKPLDIVVKKGLFDRKSINTDQLFTVVLGHKTVSASLLWALLELSGTYAVRENKPEREDFLFILRSTDEAGKHGYLAFRNIESRGDDPSTSQLKDFFRALFIAYAFKREVLIDS